VTPDEEVAMHLYRVRVEFEVVVLADDAKDAEITAYALQVPSDAYVSVGEVRTAADLQGYEDSMPFFSHSAWRSQPSNEHERTCAEWLEHLATLPPSDLELEAQGQQVFFA